jgi:hypothetical protein
LGEKSKREKEGGKPKWKGELGFEGIKGREKEKERGLFGFAEFGLLCWERETDWFSGRSWEASAHCEW